MNQIGDERLCAGQTLQDGISIATAKKKKKKKKKNRMNDSQMSNTLELPQ